MKKNRIIMLIIFLVFLIGSFSIIKVISASSIDNKIKVSYVKLDAIHTGTESFDFVDEVSYTSTENYEPGKDYSEHDRLVRSFDTITYDFDFLLSPKDEDLEFDGRTVDITVTLSPEEAKYISFGSDLSTGNTTYTYSFNSIDGYGHFSRSVTLYVLNAANGSFVNPKFTIKESTDQDNEIVLGYNNDSYSYEYENEIYSNSASFNNVMPTVVSSKEVNLSFELNSSVENEKGILNELNGRYLTYVLGVYINGNEENKIKGLSIPIGDISFDIDIDHTGNENYILNSSWIRLYSEEDLNGISPIKTSIPYSTHKSNNINKEVYNAGNITFNNNSVSINDYNVIFNFPKLNADNSDVNNSKAYIGSYAITIFSPRTESDKTNDIIDTLNISNIKINSNSSVIIIPDTYSFSFKNEFYRNLDYKLDTYFTNETGEKLSTNTVSGTLSRGSNFNYRTEFNYRDNSSNSGLKEVVKINDNAFRVVPYDNKNDININVICDNCSLTKDDFEVSFISQSFNKENYIINEIEDTEINNLCSQLDISSLTSDQIMNLYGGPCIKGINEITKSNINSFVDSNNKEIPITKIIVQTKKGKKLPNEVKVLIDIKLRVRNVMDMSRTYQAVTVASSSDYDSEFNYYSPSILSMTNKDNYTISLAGITPTKTTSETHGDSLKISNFTSSQKITVLNKNGDGVSKTKFSTKDNETIVFNIDTKLEDNGIKVGEDDTSYVENTYVDVFIGKGLNHIDDNETDKYLINKIVNNNGTYLYYKLPFSKINNDIPRIEFKTKLDKALVGDNNIIKITSNAYVKDINDNVNSDVFGTLSSEFEIIGIGQTSVTLEEEIGSNGSIVDKNKEFSYILKAYNNSTETVTNYEIIDILPSNDDSYGSKYTGSYSVKVKIDGVNSLIKTYCTSTNYRELTNNFDSDDFEECNLTEEYISNITAIKIDGIIIEGNSYAPSIELIFKPKNNNYSNTYFNGFIGNNGNDASSSNIIGVSVINRKISGVAFVDNNEDGIKDSKDYLLKNIAVSLYRIDTNNESILIDETETDSKGYYEFNNLDEGLYYVDFVYNSNLYDITRRYVTVNDKIDSDAYKVKQKEGIARISGTKDSNNSISLSNDYSLYENLDIGFIPRRLFDFSIKKYITRVDLAYNGSLETLNFDNVSKASITVRNSQKATAKVYYGMTITNNGTIPGYVKEIEEDIPDGLIFDSNYKENKGWISVNNSLKYTELEDIVINPGESKYIQIVLFMPTKEEAGIFLNNVSIISMEKYEETVLPEETKQDKSNVYSIGEEVNYAGVDWHVIDATNEGNYQKLTLLSDSGTIKNLNSLGTSVYKWSDSEANNILKSWNSAINRSSLVDNRICDDASGLLVNTYGGELSNICQSEIYVNSKIRLITVTEISKLLNSDISDLSWLYGLNPFWTQSAFKGDSYKAYYVDDNGIVNTDNITNKYELRPVITIISNKILYE